MRRILAAAVTLALAAPAAAQSLFDQVGYTDLQSRLGAATPTGANVPAAQVEAQEAANAYLPNAASFPGKSITDRSGGGGVSGHATGVGSNYYGSQSVAPGLTQIDAYKVAGDLAAGDWLGPAYLRTGTTLAPLAEPHRVQNHSWIAAGGSPNDPFVVQIQRRLDFAVGRDNVVVAVGVNNGPGPIPPLLGNSYNAIAVGLTSGNSSSGPATGDVVGRSKPDIVAPLGVTSHSTPLVAGAAAVLVQTAGQNANAGRVETIKAVLLSGPRNRSSPACPSRGRGRTTAATSSRSTAASGRAS